MDEFVKRMNPLFFQSHNPIATITRGEIAQIKQSAAFPGRNNVFEIVQKSGVIWYCQAKDTVN